MCQLEVREWGLSDKLTPLVLPPSDGTPAVLPLHLRELYWWLNETNSSFLTKVLSPHLTTITITTHVPECRPTETVGSWNKLPDDVVPLVRSAIRMFPPSLKSVCLQLGAGPEARLTEEMSAYVLGCGESLRTLATNVVLSTQAIVHLVKLPNVRAWTTEQGPPQVSDLIHHGVPDGVVSLFPSLSDLDLRGEVALEWLFMFEAAKSRTLPWIMAGNSLPMVTYDHRTLPVDSSLLSRLLPFTDLVDVYIMSECTVYGP